MTIKKDILNKYAKEKGIKFIVLFGSHSNGSPKDESDFDVAVFLDGDQSVFENHSQYSDLLANLSAALGIKSHLLDITDLRKANILLRYEITENGILLYGDDNEYASYKAFAFRDYIDAKSLFNLESFLIRKRQGLLKDFVS